MEHNSEILRTLLSKIHRGEATDAEKEIVRRWLQAVDMPDTDVPEEMLLLAKRQMLQKILHIDEMPAKTPMRRLPIIRKWVGRAAAVLFLIMGANWILSRWPAPSPQGINVTAIQTGDRVKYIVLPDSSRVWLNAHSTLEYDAGSFNSKERSICLQGEAYFEVTRQPTRPFTVSAGNITTSVLGTGFNVQTYQDDPAANITLVHGSIQVRNEENHQSVLLRPGQQLRYSTTDKQWAVTAFAGNPADNWMSGKLSFNEAPLADVLNDIAHRYHVQIKSDQHLFSNKKVTATIAEDSGLEQAIQTVLFVHRLNYTVKGSTVYVSRR